MGNEKSSPEVKNTGNHDLTIIDTQEVHTDLHLSHDIKLNIIIGLVTVR